VTSFSHATVFFARNVHFGLCTAHTYCYAWQKARFQIVALLFCVQKGFQQPSTTCISSTHGHSKSIGETHERWRKFCDTWHIVKSACCVLDDGIGWHSAAGEMFQENVIRKLNVVFWSQNHATYLTDTNIYLQGMFELTTNQCWLQCLHALYSLGSFNL